VTFIPVCDVFFLLLFVCISCWEGDTSCSSPCFAFWISLHSFPVSGSLLLLCSEVRDRFIEQQSHRINKEGYFSLQMQEYRTQIQNRKAILNKLIEFLKEAWPRPKIRKLRQGPTKATKERNREEKKKRSETKARRQRVDF